MMHFSEKSNKISFNVPLHSINIKNDTLLKTSMTSKIKINKENKKSKFKQKIVVNSVHWRAPDESTLSPLLLISSKSINESEEIIKNRTGQSLKPDVCIESFETKYGSPILCILWHPEAYVGSENKSHENQINLLNYMAKAGDVYSKKIILNNQVLSDVKLIN
jgi:hypothetical protein